MAAFGLLLALIAAAGAGFAVAWFLRKDAMAKSANFASSLEQLVSGLMRERDGLLQRERTLKEQLAAGDQTLRGRVVELEKDLAHRETQVIAFRDEAIQLAHAREELVQRLNLTEQGARELEAALTARIQELLERSAPPGPGQRVTGAERELAALMAAHETDLAELEARYLVLIQSKDTEIERLRAARASQAAASADGFEPTPPPALPGKPRSRRNRRRSHDDLTQIPGIDASLEQALHLVGVTSFRQLARWKDKDIERMAKQLYQPVERIREQRWVEAAREAHTRKYGETP